MTTTAQVKSRILEEGGNGPYKAVMTEIEGLPEHTLFVPQDLSPFNAANPLPVLVWGNGACANSPWGHENFLNEIASHGYLVLATGEIPMTDEPYRGPMSRSEQQIESLDWAFQQNTDPTSPYYGKIDTMNICVAGMSCGGLQTLFNCADPRITTLMICNSGLFKQENVAQAVGGMPMPQKDKLKEIHCPVIYIMGGKEDIAYENGMDDFRRITHVPAYMANHPVGHGGTYRQPHGGEFSAVALAWLQWQMKNDPIAAAMFDGDSPSLSHREKWTLDRNGIAAQLSPDMEFVMQLHVTLGKAYVADETDRGRKVVVPITGGTFEGPLLRGNIMSGGADTQFVEDGRTSLDADYYILTDDGVQIHVCNRGIVFNGLNEHGQKTSYFRAAPQFETPKDSRYNWLNNALFVCTPDSSQQNGITLNVWKVK